MTETRELSLVERFYGPNRERSDPSNAQLDYILKLASSHTLTPQWGTCGEERIENVFAHIENTHPDRFDCSRWIDWAKNTPFDRSEKSADEPTELVAIGIYRVPDGTPGIPAGIYVVKASREDHTRRYAKKLVEIDSTRLTESGETIKMDFEFVRGAIYKIRPEYRMAPEDAKRVAVLYKHCLMCGRKLKLAESVERAIGPVCIKHVDWK